MQTQREEMTPQTRRCAEILEAVLRLTHMKHLDGFCEPGCPYCVERPGWDE